MAKISENMIPDINADWGLDASNNLPYSGEAVQEFIKRTLKQKYGYFHYDDSNNRYLVFADEESKDKYLANPSTNSILLLSSFDAPFNYSAKIEMLSESYNAILIGTLGNNIQFKFAVEDKSGNNTGENVDCVITLINTGVKKTINKVYTAQQGREGVLIELDDYLFEGTNNISITIKGQNTLAATTVSIVYQVINLQLSDNLDISNVYNVGDVLPITFTVNGYGTKTMEWFLDGKQLPTESDIDEIFSNSEVTNNKFISLDKIDPGVHSIQFRVYTIVDGQKFYSNTLFRNFLVKGLDSTLIGVATELPIGVEPVKNNTLTQLYGLTQYVPYELRYAIYNPADSATNLVNVYVNNNLQLTTNIINNKENIASIVVNDFGEVYIKLEVNKSSYEISTNVAVSTINVAEISSNLVLDLRAFGKDNDSEDKDSWTYGDYSAEFDGFYWNSQSGWIDNTLIINSGATVNINYSPLNPNPIDTGKTLEFEFATRNVVNDDSVVLDLTTNEGVGLLITASEAKLIASDKSEVSTKFRAGENNRIAFVINMNENTTNACLMFIYVNGVLCGAARFSTAANLKCNKTITFNSDSDILLKHLRFYNRALSSDEILNNYILYRDSISEMLNIYNRNDIYETGTETLSPEKLLNSIPVMYITCLDKDRGIPYLEGRFDEAAKDERIYCDIEYQNAQDKTKNFKVDYARVRIQGTSSIKYPRKNYRFYTAKEDETVLYDWQGNVVENRKYAFKDNSIPVDCWCLKADYAESSGAHNTGVARIWNDLLKNATINKEYVFRTDAQKKAVENNYNYDVRTCIDGFPIVVFYRMSYNDPWIFLGKYNFNNDKSTENVFGFKGIPGFDNSRMQCWEVLNNGHPLCNFVEYSSEYFDNNWEDAFEARYPDDGSDAYTGDLKAFCDWIYGTKNNIEKFKTEKWDHLDVYKMAAYYVYVMRFGAVDQTVKNSMFTSEDGEHFYFINYDNDTILGLKNDGSLRFGPDVDRQSIDPSFTEADDDVYVYAGHDSVLWNNMEADDEFMAIVQEVDHALYSAGLTYDNLINMFEDEQTAKWCERVFNKDAQYKYISPDNGRLLSLQGPRNAHRRWWLSQRFNIYDAKFLTGDFPNNSITFKLNGAPAGSTFKIKAAKNLPYGYGIVNGASEITKVLNIGEEYTFTIPQIVNVGDPVSIYGSPNISEIDLTNIVSYMSEIDFTKAYSPTIGSSIKKLYLSGNNTAMTSETLDGMNSLIGLEKLDIQGLKAVTTLDISNLIKLKKLFAKNSGLTSVDLAPGCLIERLELPISTEVVQLTDLPLLTANNLVMDGNWSKVREIHISGCPNLTNNFDVIWNWYNITNNSETRILELYGVNWENVSLDNLIELGENINIRLRGIIKLSRIDDKYKLLRLKELYGNNIFNKESDLYIYGPDSIYVFGPEKVLEGDSVQFDTIVFSENSGNILFSLLPKSEDREGVKINDNGLMTTIENGLPTTEYNVQVIYNRGLNDRLIDRTSLIVEKRVYPESIIITVNKILEEITEYTWDSPTTNITGNYTAKWIITGDVLNHVKIDSQSPDKCTVARTSIPDFVAMGQIKLSLIKNVNNSIIAEASLSISEINPNVLMTIETNPKVMNVFRTYGLIDNSKEYLLKSEAALFTENDFKKTDTSTIFQNSGISRFDEFEYFTGITTLQIGFFENLESLVSVKLPSSVTTINRSAFANTGLTTIYISSNVGYIDPDAFSFSENLINIEVDSNNRVYFSDEGCVYLIDYTNTLYLIAPGLIEYKMPNRTTAVYGEVVWKNGRELQKIILNNSVTGVKGNWFLYGFSNLTEVTGPEDHPDINFYNGCIYRKDFSELIYYPSGKEYSEDLLHENVTKFGNYSFVQHKKLKDVVIPNNITHLGNWVFYYSSMTSLIVHENVESIGEYCFYWCQSLKSAEINSPNLSGVYVLGGCSNLTNVSLSNLTPRLPDGTFSSISNLVEIDLPENITSIGIECFANCSKLEQITIPSKVTSIGRECFRGCLLLGDINCFPTIAPSLGSNVFGANTANYTGINALNKTLSIVSGATGYEENDWKTVLQDTVGFILDNRFS